MRVRLYTTLERKKEVFKPIRQDWVGLYTCGPTVYNYVHIGNLRTYIFQDVLKRTLKYVGYKIRHVMNITDVDDKTIKNSQKAGKTLREFTRAYEKFFKEDLKKLNIEFPERFTRATEYIPEMVKIISLLLKRGYAYQKDSSVYFSISKFKNYGRLTRLDKGGLKAGARVDADEYAKDEVQDFVLWKASKSGEPAWLSPFGKGRPGWHIECSAMSTKYLGQPFDLHTGAVDLIFPHHENEIAQSEGAYGKKFVKYWIHGEHLLVDGQKMSKSLGNIYTLRDLEAKGFNPLVFRYLVLSAHFRSKLNFTWKSLGSAQNSLERIYDFIRILCNYRSSTSIVASRSTYRSSTSIYHQRFRTAISDDLDTPKTLAVIWRFIRDYHKNHSRYNPKEVLSALYEFDRVLGLGFEKIKPEKIPGKIVALAQKREKLRLEKEWQEADKIRKEIQILGYTAEDTPRGSKIKKL